MPKLFNTLSIGNVRIYYETCTSTNLIAKQLIANNSPIDGTVISTANQTEGRGQYGNSWKSEKNKDLTCSVILKPTFLVPQQQFYLSKIVSLSIVVALKKLFSEKVKIKWPNDIYFETSKLGGILIENQINSNAIAWSVVGIGLNVNQVIFSKELNATSLQTIFNREVEIETIQDGILLELDNFYLKLRQNKFDLINKLYLENLFQYQKKQLFEKNGEQFYALVEGVEESGKLNVLHDGKKESFQFKEVRWIF